MYLFSVAGKAGRYGQQNACSHVYVLPHHVSPTYTTQSVLFEIVCCMSFIPYLHHFIVGYHYLDNDYSLYVW